MDYSISVPSQDETFGLSHLCTSAQLDTCIPSSGNRAHSTRLNSHCATTKPYDSGRLPRLANISEAAAEPLLLERNRQIQDFIPMYADMFDISIASGTK